MDALTIALFKDGGFAYPIYDPGDARNAVEWLHENGMKYNEIARHCNENKGNFSLWRRERQPRVPTGNRVIEFLNRAYQEARTDDYNDDGGESDVNDDDIDDDIDEVDDKVASPEVVSEHADGDLDALANANHDTKVTNSGNSEHQSEAIDTITDAIDTFTKAIGLAKDITEKYIIEDMIEITMKRTPVNGPGFVYILRDKNTRFKVGSSNNVSARLSNLSVGNIDLRLVIAFPVEQRLTKERECHKRLKSAACPLVEHIDREWFKAAADDIIAEVRQTCGH